LGAQAPPGGGYQETKKPLDTGSGGGKESRDTARRVRLFPGEQAAIATAIPNRMLRTFMSSSLHDDEFDTANG